MDYVRTNVLGRSQSSEGRTQDSEQQRLPEMGEQRGSRTRRFSISRPPLPSLFTSRSRMDRQDGRNQRTEGDIPEDDSPKTPRFNLGLPNMPSTRLHLPNLTRTWTRGSSGPASPTQASQPPPEPTPQLSLPRIQVERLPAVSQPPPSHGGPDTGRSRYRGADPGETHLVDVVGRGRRQRHSQSRTHTPEQRPKKLLFCFPWIKSRRMRSYILRCFVSGIFLIVMLAVYLALSITKNVNTSEFTVLLILIILFATIFFCHGLIRICMLIIRPPNEEDEERPSLPRLLEPGGYAVPRRPIHVILARDEEAAGIDDTSNKMQPPAYGLWRESVRVDPDRLYWQRNDQPPREGGEEEPRPGTARPPSYASEDGVSYVVEARPRSMVPTTDVPLLPHPEAGRLR
ncbi:uncharacterized protein GGS22DRAFT_81252 [Annulohypoxylon maeteangense]|uniref:uncharacterized protein n=1 Tax=Annulohypoxylon maeteangense TaxID=1927788 RepID=UPI002007929A|nr:uncharacterized protein GGS22DRAFT_81252 [Annulohypoxylon maeteangense]KAI0880632.1 hypothetical protein GGS22DRAFT_81252 [Annulohypoxylon maeteangense]